METITKSCVLIQAPVQTKEEAIRLAGRLLVDAGYIAPPYVDSLMQREAVSNTFLGAGVAIPHGMIEDRHHVRHTGIAVLQVPGGIPWQEGKEARLIVAIAAQSDEHIAILRRLTRLMQQQGAIDELATCTDPGRIVAALTDTPYVPPPRRGRPTRAWSSCSITPTACTPGRRRAGSRRPGATPARCACSRTASTPTPNP